MWGYTNPVIDSNNPDPAALALPGGGYLAVATSNYATNSAAEDAFPIYHSADLVDWELRGHVFPAGAWPAYCDRNMWAPEIHRVNGRCGPAPAPSPRTATVSAAGTWPTSPARRLTGGTRWAWRCPPPPPPWAPTPTPWACPSSTTTRSAPPLAASCSPLQLLSPVQDSVVGCLDQSYFKDPQTGQDYILWKTDEIAFPIRTGVIYIQELQPSGTALLAGSVKQLMIEVDR